MAKTGARSVGILDADISWAKAKAYDGFCEGTRRRFATRQILFHPQMPMAFSDVDGLFLTTKGTPSCLAWTPMVTAP